MTSTSFPMPRRLKNRRGTLRGREALRYALDALGSPLGISEGLNRQYAEAADAKRIACALLRHLRGLGPATIGRDLDLHHTTVIEHLRRHDDRLSTPSTVHDDYAYAYGVAAAAYHRDHDPYR